MATPSGRRQSRRDDALQALRGGRGRPSGDPFSCYFFFFLRKTSFGILPTINCVPSTTSAA